MALDVFTGCLKADKAAGWNVGAFLWAYTAAMMAAMSQDSLFKVFWCGRADTLAR